MNPVQLANAANWAQILWATGALVATLGAGAKIFFSMKHKLDNIEAHTYKRNDGSSMADALARLEEAIHENTKITQKISREVAKLEGRFENHVSEGKRWIEETAKNFRRFAALGLNPLLDLRLFYILKI